MIPKIHLKRENLSTVRGWLCRDDPEGDNGYEEPLALFAREDDTELCDGIWIVPCPSDIVAGECPIMGWGKEEFIELYGAESLPHRGTKIQVELELPPGR